MYHIVTCTMVHVRREEENVEETEKFAGNMRSVSSEDLNLTTQPTQSYVSITILYMWEISETLLMEKVLKKKSN